MTDNEHPLDPIERANVDHVENTETPIETNVEPIENLPTMAKKKDETQTAAQAPKKSDENKGQNAPAKTGGTAPEKKGDAKKNTNAWIVALLGLALLALVAFLVNRRKQREQREREQGIEDSEYSEIPDGEQDIDPRDVRNNFEQRSAFIDPDYKFKG